MSFSDLTPDEGQLDSGNSTTTPLAADATFTGDWVDVSNFAAITVFIYSDQDSASLGGVLQFSTDASNVDLVISGTYSGNVGHPVTVQPQARYFRFVYTNGSTLQTEFRVQTILRRVALTDPHLRVDDHIPSDFTLPIQRNVITGLSSAGGGEYVNVKVNPSGSLVTEPDNQAANTTVTGNMIAYWETQEVKVGASPLANRKEVHIFVLNKSQEVNVGYDSNLSHHNCIAHLEHHDHIIVSATESQPVYVNTENKKVRIAITEVAYG